MILELGTYKLLKNRYFKPFLNQKEKPGRLSNAGRLLVAGL